MNRTRRLFRKELPATLAACLLAASFTAGLLFFWHCRQQLALLDGFCTALIARAPETADAVYTLAKAGNFASVQPGVLSGLGYEAGDFAGAALPVAAAAGTSFLLAGGLWLAGWVWQRRRLHSQLQRLITQLEAARAGGPQPLWGAESTAEGPLACLADELGKTVTELARTRAEAVSMRNTFADHLANIAHQLKTPLTALSLQVQAADGACRRAMAPQLARLSRLAESLLLLARLDAGALPLRPAPADLFTLLMMAADQLQPLAAARGVTLDVQELPALTVYADHDWTVEAFLNLFKNCVEHAPAGSAVRCRCIENPLYTEICIQDEGPGFAPKDLPRLFERFYRGANARPDSAGIGLSIAKELLERQNATVSATNAPAGGGMFVVRFYRAGVPSVTGMSFSFATMRQKGGHLDGSDSM